MADDAWDLEMELLCLPASGSSTKQMHKLAQRIARACGDVPEHVRELAGLPSDSHRERDLHRWVQKQPWRSVLPPTYEFDLPYTSDYIHLGVVRHAAFLPHEVMASLSKVPELFEELLTGPPGNLERFWQNTSSTDWYRRHPHPAVHEDHAHCIPCGIHGDDAGVFQNEKVLVLTWGSVARELLTLDSRILFSAVQFAHAVPDMTIPVLYEVLTWSLNVMSSGVFPAADHRGVPFSETYHPQRFALAGSNLTDASFVGVWSEMRGDWKFQVEALELEANYQATWCCHLCRANKKIKRLYFTQFRRNAHIRRTHISSSAHRDSYGNNRPHFTRILGFDIWRVWVDAMHCMDLGVYQSVAASCLLDLVDLRCWDAGTNSEAFNMAHSEYKAWCSFVGVPACPRFEKSKLVSGALEFPAFTQKQAKASQTRYLIRWMAQMCSKPVVASSQHGPMLCAMMTHFVLFEDTCDKHDRWIPGPDRVVLAEHMENALVCMNAMHRIALDAGKYRWQLTPKCHMATHMVYDMAATGINPRRTTCYADEDMVGRTKKIMSKCHGSTAGKRCMDRYAILVGTRWWKRLAEIRGMR